MWRAGIIRAHLGSRRTNQRCLNEGPPNAGPAVVGRNAVATWSLRKAATTNDADNSRELRFHQAFAKRCSGLSAVQGVLQDYEVVVVAE
jgi:hypothetical protein